MEQKANAAQRSASYQQNWNTYNQIKLEIKQVEYKIEAMENQAEMAARTGALSYAQYQQIDYELDRLDDRLDWAEDSLEYRLGVDD